jgi:hypothetical protein
MAANMGRCEGIFSAMKPAQAAWKARKVPAHSVLHVIGTPSVQRSSGPSQQTAWTSVVPAPNSAQSQPAAGPSRRSAHGQRGAARPCTWRIL